MRRPLLRISGAGRVLPARVAWLGALGAIMLTGCALWPGNASRSENFVSPLQAAHIKANDLKPAQALTGGRARFIVKVEGVERLEELTRLWYTDRDTARQRYKNWAADQAAFEGLELYKCSYSGEIVLQREFASDEASDEAAVNAILERIRAHPRVAYADPEFTAHPGLKGD